MEHLEKDLVALYKDLRELHVQQRNIATLITEKKYDIEHKVNTLKDALSDQMDKTFSEGGI